MMRLRDEVSTTRGSGWVNQSLPVSQAESIHPLPRVVLTFSKRAVLGMGSHLWVCFKSPKYPWTQSVQGAVATWSSMGVENRREYLMPITDQVATAPCTDCVQVRRPTLRQTITCYRYHDAIE